MKSIVYGCILIVLAPISSIAGKPEVVNVVVTPTADGTYRFSVTLRHEDSGWQHYADRWEILDTKGTVLATRVLMHPHVDEQPFTRTLSGVAISPEIKEVLVRGHDSVHGYGEKSVRVPLD